MSTSEEKTKNRLRVQSWHARKRAEMGDRAYLDMMAEKQRRYRAGERKPKANPQLCANIIQEFYDNAKASDQPLSYNTVKAYFKNASRVYKLMTGKDWDCKSFDWMLDREKVVEFIRNQWKTPRTQQMYISQLTGLLKRMPDHRNVYAQYSADVMSVPDKRIYNEMDEDEKKRILPWRAILDAKPQGLDKQQKLLFELMRDVPRRAGTYRILQYREDDIPDANYLIWRDDSLRLVLKKYKIQALRAYGEQEYPLNLKTVSALRALNPKAGSYLWPAKSGKPMDNSRFVQYLVQTSKKAFGDDHGMGSRDWRKSKASFISKQNISVAEKTASAQRLGHSLKELMLYSKLEL